MCTSLPPHGRKSTDVARFLCAWQATKASHLREFTRRNGLHHGARRDERGAYAYAQYGSWLFMTALSHRSCFLFDLLSREKIMLPAPPRGSRYISNVVITSSPLGKGSFKILSYRRDRNVFLFHRLLEDKKWDMVKCNVQGGIRSFVRCNGVVYAIAGSTGELAVIDVAPCPKVTILHVEDWRTVNSMNNEKQLLESCGELFEGL
ncbi:hypothetical protein Taro_033582 [Colocasia esculenta]|uniref:KIB1-4 beta-propeller domain-containing protein n=1 Tax=Colocasia esculenta TaxID=4460 RepID=A0A843VVN8_COLES|nr:hypothetical protein [Colocasia esculenta]